MNVHHDGLSKLRERRESKWLEAQRGYIARRCSFGARLSHCIFFLIGAGTILFHLLISHLLELFSLLLLVFAYVISNQ